MEGGSGKKKVVVIGGGIAGSFVAESLQFHADVVLIDPKEYFEIPWAVLRAMVEPSFAQRFVINYTDYLKNCQLVTATATGVTEKEVTTSDNHSFPYDYLFIATGHSDSFPLSRPERLKEYEDVSEKIKSANSVLIVGGGPTGVELAGEISVDFPEKKITLVHRGTRLLEFLGPKSGKKAMDWLTSKKVEVILGQSVDLNSVNDDIYITDKGETIKADCHFLCLGKPTGSSWLKNTFLGNDLDGSGRLMVDELFRVKGCNNVFAVGDITDVKEMKQGYLAEKHAEISAKNLKLILGGGQENKMSKYKPGSDLAIVSLGRKEAVAQFPFVTLIGCIPGMIKSKDLFVGKTRKQLGLQP